MDNIAFWKEWEKNIQLVFKILVFLLLGLLATFLIVEWGNLSPFYYWKITGYLENIPFSIFSNHSDFIESTVTTDLPVIFQKVFGGSKALAPGYTYVYLALLYIGLVGCLTIATYLEKFWYFLSMGLWILLIMLSGIGKIGLFGFYNEGPVILITLLFLPVSYYFNSIHASFGMRTRFLVFLGLLAITFLLIHFGSSYGHALLFFARFSYLPAALVCLIFILVIGHEIVYAILSLTTPYSKSSSNNTTHFIVLSTVYLLNLAAVYLNRIGYLDWDIYYLNEFAVIAISAILGIWGVKSRENRYGRILPFYPYAALLYLSMAVISMATLAYQSLHANDPFMESMQNLILYSHIGFGSMFFLYIIGNFITQLKQNLPVHQFAYVEDNFPYISARLAGLIVAAALFFRAHYSSFYQAVAGYYNGLGDLTLSLGKDEVAKYYYGESVGQSRNNHHANFQLALSEKKPAYRLARIKNSIKKQPTPYAYASLGRAYEINAQFFEALFAYQEGLKKFPRNWALQNNLALLYNQTHVVDSAIYYLNSSTPNSWKEAVVQANLEGISAIHNLGMQDDRSKDLSRFDLQSNVLANKLISNDTSQLAFVTEPQSISLNLFTYSYLKNLGLYSHQSQPTEFLRLIDIYLAAPENISFRRELMLVKALNLYQRGRIAGAIEMIYQLMEGDEDQTGKWNSLLGKWCLELQAPMQAARHFEIAREWGYPNVSADLAQAYLQLGDESLALFLLSKETEPKDSLEDSQTTAWASLFNAMKAGRSGWQVYSFEKEKQALEDIKMANGEKSTFYRRLGLDNPFFEPGVIAAVNHFYEIEKDEETAYEIIHQAISINEYSVQLIKAYIDHCLKTGLIDFAEEALTKLKEILPYDDYSLYIERFNLSREIAQSRLDQDW